jgi:hypothetical protein
MMNKKEIRSKIQTLRYELSQIRTEINAVRAQCVHEWKCNRHMVTCLICDYMEKYEAERHDKMVFIWTYESSDNSLEGFFDDTTVMLPKIERPSKGAFASTKPESPGAGAFAEDAEQDPPFPQVELQPESET